MDRTNLEHGRSPKSRHTEDVAVIASAHVNAVGIAQSLREIGWRGDIVCLKDIALYGDSGTAVADRFENLCTVEPIRFQESIKTLRWIQDRWSDRNRRVLFFTDERLFDAISNGRLPIEGWEYFVGSAEHMPSILDRQRFYAFARSHTNVPVPRTFGSEIDPWKEFGGPFWLRVMRSWQGNVLLPRGRVISSPDQLQEWRAVANQFGLADSEWGYQELLDTRPQANISVCGWHDRELQLYVVTRKIEIQKPPNNIGWLIERISDPGKLESWTRDLLVAMDYNGPFEMEFVKTDDERRYCLVELNPRFWMQHRLIASLTDNALVRRYIGNDLVRTTSRPSGPKYWIDVEQALKVVRKHPLRLIGLATKMVRSEFSVPIWQTVRSRFRSLNRGGR